MTMISNQIHFSVAERNNAHTDSGKEWALNAQMVGHSQWALMTWDTKPEEKAVNDAKRMIMRAFEFYHRHLRIPQFNLQEAKE